MKDMLIILFILKIYINRFINNEKKLYIKIFTNYYEITL